MTFTIDAIHFHVLPMQTRLPFRYGIASLTALPHLFVSADLVIDGQLTRGQSADGLPPKWFTKNPDLPFEVDLAEMIAAIQNAARIGRIAAEHPTTFAPWWRDLHDEQESWSAVREVPPLLAHFGVSLIERAVIDALARHAQTPLWKLLSSGQLELPSDSLRPGIQATPLAELMKSTPLCELTVRQTIGLCDPISDGDISPDERIDDGLPESLEALINAYRLSSFKIKLSGSMDQDRDRLHAVADLTQRLIPQGPSFTVDGNEHFASMEAFRDYWLQLAALPNLQPILDRTRFIEQPLHRDHALSDAVQPCLKGWDKRPPIIIDESDGSLDDLPCALELGYAGTSHKNCKGIVKGIANASLLHSRPNTLLTGEDLANVGPTALLQDLAMMALLGINDVERNGHHYFKGLSMHSPRLQRQVVDSHPDLYPMHPAGYPSLAIQRGQLNLGSVNEAPFGCRPVIDTDTIEPLNDWIKRGGMSG